MTRILAIVCIAILTACNTVPIEPDPIYRETQIRQSRPKVAGEVFDHQEADVRLINAFDSADTKAERLVGNVPRDDNFVFEFWRVKKGILKKQFGIDWKTPAELSPSITYESYGQPAITIIEDKFIRQIVTPRLENGEEIFAIWREFEGGVKVSTKTTVSDTLRQFTLAGHDNSWIITSQGEIIFH